MYFNFYEGDENIKMERLEKVRQADEFEVKEDENY
jgi:hypothetical protein